MGALHPVAWGGTGGRRANGHTARRSPSCRDDGTHGGTALDLVPRVGTRADDLRHPAVCNSARWVVARVDPPGPPFLSHNRIGATAAKDIRYSMRDPPACRSSPPARDPGSRAVGATQPASEPVPAATTLLALIAVLPVAGLTLNQFGLDMRRSG